MQIRHLFFVFAYNITGEAMTDHLYSSHQEQEALLNLSDQPPVHASWLQ